MANYQAKCQWGGKRAPWNEDGTWAIGTRDAGNQFIVKIQVSSADEGNTLEGIVRYTDEGDIGFRATHLGSNKYAISLQWGGRFAPWNDEGEWVIGGRDTQRISAINVEWVNNNKLEGTCTYAGEGLIGLLLEK